MDKPFGQTSSAARASLDDQRGLGLDPAVVALITVSITVLCICLLVALCMLRRRLSRLSAAYNRVLAQRSASDSTKDVEVVRIVRGRPPHASNSDHTQSWSVTGGQPLGDH